jgi:uncharacterized membrane protein YphA (DoxX/SURF4 family)
MSSTESRPVLAPSGALHVALWIAQVLLGVAFIMAGALKATQPIDALLAKGMGFVAYRPEALVRFIGVSELLGGIGLVAPAATRILPRLTGVAAAALAVVMVLAVGEHATHDGLAAGAPAAVLGLLCAFVAWGRLVRAPIPAR